MCGLLTYFNPNGLSEQEIDSALSSLQIIRHRGPDGEGVMLVNTLTGQYKNIQTLDTPDDIDCVDVKEELKSEKYDLLLGHRRLSILDLSTNGHQPMVFHNIIIIFNGEIYNFIEIRKLLQKEGFLFNTECDTEVILAAYRFWGKDCFSKFNGMWAIIMFDIVTKELIISNDRFGVKPLHYFQSDGSLLVFSEIKQILAFPEFKTDVNEQVVEVFMNTDTIAYNSETFFKNIFRFNPASYLIATTNQLNINLNSKSVLFYKISDTNFVKKSIEDLKKEFRALLIDAVKIRLRSDVEWGISLSGGLDSTSIAFAAKEILKQKEFTTFSIIADKNSPEDESYFINLANEILNSKNIQENPKFEFNEKTFVKHIYHMDTPVPSTAFFANYTLKKVIKNKDITVLLSGQGGDEILGGYHQHFYKYCIQLFMQLKLYTLYREINLWSKMKNFTFRQVLIHVVKGIYLSLKTKAGIASLPYQFQQKAMSTLTLNQYLKEEISVLQLPFYLQADDRCSMAFGVESRNPFLDYRLVDFSINLPASLKIKNGWQKWIMREAIVEMPEELRFRKDKKGFSTPADSWINENKEMLLKYSMISDQKFPQFKNKDFYKRATMGAWLINFNHKN